MSKKTPLLDLLRSVPKDATQAYQHYDGSSRNIPYGSLCSNAAKRIEELEKLCCDLESELTSVWSDVHSENEMHANKYFIESVKCAAEALEDQATILKDWCIRANKERGE